MSIIYLNLKINTDCKKLQNMSNMLLQMTNQFSNLKQPWLYAHGINTSGIQKGHNGENFLCFTCRKLEGQEWLDGQGLESSKILFTHMPDAWDRRTQRLELPTKVLTCVLSTWLATTLYSDFKVVKLLTWWHRAPRVSVPASKVEMKVPLLI